MIDCDWSYNGIKICVLNNDTLHISILPEIGRIIWSVKYNGYELMYHHYKELELPWRFKEDFPRYSTRYSPWGNSPTGTCLPPSTTRALALSSPTVSSNSVLELTYQGSKTLPTTLNSSSRIGSISKNACIFVLNSTFSPLSFNISTTFCGMYGIIATM